MGDLAEGESTTAQGSGSSVYTLKNIGGVYSCTCPAWMHQSLAIERRTCKHLRALRGDDAEQERVGANAMLGRPSRSSAAKADAATDEARASASANRIGAEPALLLAHKWEGEVD